MAAGFTDQVPFERLVMPDRETGGIAGSAN